MKIQDLILLFFAGAYCVSNAIANEDSFGFSCRYNLYDAPTQVSIIEDSYQLVLRGDTEDGQMRGVGVLEGKIDQAEKVALWKSLKNAPRDEFGAAPQSAYDPYVKSFFRKGTQRVKLDVVPRIATSQDGALLLALDFKNSGKESVMMENPMKWEGMTNRVNGDSYIAVVGRRKSTAAKADQYFLIDNIGGKNLSAPAGSQEAPFEIPVNQTRTVNFSVFPKDRIKKGAYLLGATIAINGILAPESIQGVVEFASLDGHVEFSRDYPSTPKEVALFNAFHAKQDEQREY